MLSSRNHGMDVHESEATGKGFEAYLEEFSDCFGRWDTASYLGVYVEGQHSDLPRKSAEPIALRAEIAPRSLQDFLGTARWDEARMVDRVQEIVARDHGDPFAIGSARGRYGNNRLPRGRPDLCRAGRSGDLVPRQSKAR